MRVCNRDVPACGALSVTLLTKRSSLNERSLRPHDRRWILSDLYVLRFAALREIVFPNMTSVIRTGYPDRRLLSSHLDESVRAINWCVGLAVRFAPCRSTTAPSTVDDDP